MSKPLPGTSTALSTLAQPAPIPTLGSTPLGCVSAYTQHPSTSINPLGQRAGNTPPVTVSMQIPATTSSIATLRSSLFPLPVDWCNQTDKKDLIQLFKLSSSVLSQPASVLYCIIVKPDRSWKVFVNGQRVEKKSTSVLSAIPDRLLDRSAVMNLIFQLNSAFVCCGLPKAGYIKMAKARKDAVFRNADNAVRATIDSSHPVCVNGETLRSTIRTTDCEVLSNSPLCVKCRAFRPVLRSSYSRWLRSQSAEISKFTNDRYLTSEQKETKLKTLQVAAERKRNSVKQDGARLYAGSQLKTLQNGVIAAEGGSQLYEETMKTLQESVVAIEMVEEVGAQLCVGAQLQDSVKVEQVGTLLCAEGQLKTLPHSAVATEFDTQRAHLKTLPNGVVAAEVEQVGTQRARLKTLPNSAVAAEVVQLKTLEDSVGSIEMVEQQFYPATQLKTLQDNVVAMKTLQDRVIAVEKICTQLYEGAPFKPLHDGVMDAQLCAEVMKTLQDCVVATEKF